MTIKDNEFIDLPTPTGPMRTHLFRPQAAGRFPGIVFYSEIFQVTGPIRRLASFLAGHGFLVACLEIWHEFEPLGCTLAYDQAGADRGNALKKEKLLEGMDGDSKAVLDYLKSHPACSGKLGALGLCIGGHLSIRTAATNPEVRAAAAIYPTDLHKRSLSKSGDNTLDLAKHAKGELFFVFGRQDPHVPAEGRALIYQELSPSGVSMTWHEFNGQHAFIRDEGHRYDPALEFQVHGLLLELFQRRLGGQEA